MAMLDKLLRGIAKACVVGISWKLVVGEIIILVRLNLSGGMFILKKKNCRIVTVIAGALFAQVVTVNNIASKANVATATGRAAVATIHRHGGQWCGRKRNLTAQLQEWRIFSTQDTRSTRSLC